MTNLLFIEDTLPQEIAKWVVLILFVLLILGVLAIPIRGMIVPQIRAYKETYSKDWRKQWNADGRSAVGEFLRNFRLKLLNPFYVPGKDEPADVRKRRWQLAALTLGLLLLILFIELC